MYTAYVNELFLIFILHSRFSAFMISARGKTPEPESMWKITPPSRSVIPVTRVTRLSYLHTYAFDFFPVDHSPPSAHLPLPAIGLPAFMIKDFWGAFSVLGLSSPGVFVRAFGGWKRLVFSKNWIRWRALFVRMEGRKESFSFGGKIGSVVYHK